MSKISRSTPLAALPAQPPAPAAPAAPAPAPLAGDRFTPSSPRAAQADALRTLTTQIEACLAFKPRTTSQAIAWREKGQALKAQATALIDSGALTSLPLKERSVLRSDLHRLDVFLKAAPGIVRFISGAD